MVLVNNKTKRSLFLIYKPTAHGNMQGRLYKNIQNRVIFKSHETNKQIYKMLIHNRRTNTSLLNLTSVQNQNFDVPKRASACSIKNLCFLTAKARSTYRDFRLNRNMIKNLVSKKLLQGVKRSSW